MTTATRTLTTQEKRVLRELFLSDGGLTVDEFVGRNGLYVNSWAPIFTHLRKAGLVTRTGRTRPTRHGSTAHVINLTNDGILAYRKGRV